MNKQEVIQEARDYVNAFRDDIIKEIQKGNYFEVGSGNLNIELE